MKWIPVFLAATIFAADPCSIPNCCPEGALYRNNPKNREFGKETPRNFCLEQATIAARQGASENKKDAAKPTQQIFSQNA